MKWCFTKWRYVSIWGLFFSGFLKHICSLPHSIGYTRGIYLPCLNRPPMSNTPMSENTTASTNVDPFADRESKNYDNPVPSEFILSFLTSGISMNRNDLFKRLALLEGAIWRSYVVVYVLWAWWTTGLHSSPMLRVTWKVRASEGYVIGHKDGHGWVRPDGIKAKGWRYSTATPSDENHHARWLRIGSANGQLSKRGSRREGRLVRVLEERTTPIVGRFFLEYGHSYVAVADDSRISHDILIPTEHKGGARMGNNGCDWNYWPWRSLSLTWWVR